MPYNVLFKQVTTPLVNWFNFPWIIKQILFWNAYCFHNQWANVTCTYHSRLDYGNISGHWHLPGWVQSGERGKGEQLCQKVFLSPITKTCLYNVDPIKPHFYIVKLGFTGLYIIFLISAQNMDCGYSLEPTRRGGSNEYPQSMFWAEIWKLSEFLSENFQFLVVKFSIYLNRHVFVMGTHLFCGVEPFQQRSGLQKSKQEVAKVVSRVLRARYNEKEMKVKPATSFNIVKLGFTGLYIIFLTSAQNMDCGYSLEPTRRGGSNEYPQSMFWAEIWNLSEFLSENFQFLVVKFSIYLNRHVFVMGTHLFCGVEPFQQRSGLQKSKQEVAKVVSRVLRARYNEKEMKVKPATSFKIIYNIY